MQSAVPMTLPPSPDTRGRPCSAPGIRPMQGIHSRRVEPSASFHNKPATLKKRPSSVLPPSNCPDPSPLSCENLEAQRVEKYKAERSCVLAGRVRTLICNCPSHFCSESLIMVRPSADKIQAPYRLSACYDLRPRKNEIRNKSIYLVAYELEKLRKYSSTGGMGLDFFEASNSWIARDCISSEIVPMKRECGEVQITLEPPDISNGEVQMLLRVVVVGDPHDQRDWRPIGDAVLVRVDPRLNRQHKDFLLTLERSLEASEKKANNFQKALHDSHEKYSGVVNKAKKMKAELDKSRSEKQAQLEKSISESRDLQRAADELQSQLVKSEGKSQELQGRIDQFHSKVEQQAKQLEVKDRELKSAEAEHKESLRSLRHSLEASEKKANGFEKSLDESHEKIVEMESDANKVKSQLEESISASHQLQRTVDELQPLLAKSRSENQDLQDNVEKLRSNVADLDEKLEAKGRQLEREDKEHKEIVRSLQSSFEVSDEKRRTLQMELDDLRETYAEMVGEASTLKAELEESQSEKQAALVKTASEKQDLQRTIDELQSQVVKARSERDGLQESVRELSSNVARLEGELEAKGRQLEREGTEHEENIRSLQKSLEASENRANGFESTLAESHAKIVEMEHGANKLKSQLEESESEKHAALVKSTSENQDLQRNIDDLQSQLVKSRLENQGLQEHVGKLHSQVAVLEEELETKGRQLEGEGAEHEEVVRSLRSSLEASEKKAHGFEQALKESLAKTSEMEGEANKVKAELEESQSEKQAALVKFASENQNLQLNIDELQSQLVKSRSENQEWQNSVEKLHSNIADLEKKLEAKNRQMERESTEQNVFVGSLQRSLEEAEDKLNSVQNALDESHEKYLGMEREASNIKAELEKSRSDQQAELIKSRSESSALQQKVDEMRSQFAKSQSESQELQDKMNKLHSTVDTLEADLKTRDAQLETAVAKHSEIACSLQRALQASEEKADGFQKALDESREMYSAMANESRQVKAELEKSRSENNEALQKSMSYMSERHDFQGKIDELQSKLLKLEEQLQTKGRHVESLEAELENQRIKADVMARWLLMNRQVDHIKAAVDLFSEMDCAQAMVSVRISKDPESQFDLEARVTAAVCQQLERYAVREEDVKAVLDEDDGKKLIINVSVKGEASVQAIVDELVVALDDASASHRLIAALDDAGVEASGAEVTVDWAMERVKAAIDFWFLDLTGQPKYPDLAASELEQLKPLVVESHEKYTKCWEEYYIEDLENFPSEHFPGGFRQDAETLDDILQDAKAAQLQLKQRLVNIFQQEELSDSQKWTTADFNDSTYIPLDDARRLLKTPIGDFFDPGIKKRIDVEKKAAHLLPPSVVVDDDKRLLPYNKLRDIARCGIVFKDARSLLQSAQTIRETFGADVMWCKNNFTQPSVLGYRDLNMGLRLHLEENAHTAELQLHLEQLYDLRQGTCLALYKDIHDMVQAFGVEQDDLDPLLHVVLDEMGCTEGASKRKLYFMIDDVQKDFSEADLLCGDFVSMVERIECTSKLDTLNQKAQEIYEEEQEVEAQRRDSKGHCG